MKITLILLLVYTICEYSAYVPQIVKLIRTKSADDLSKTTWLTWVVAAACYLAYVLLESPESGIIFVAVMNLVFIITVSILTVYYQKINKAKKRSLKKTRINGK
jgi:uncharacterized protein with PQ loop repeat